MAWKQTQQAELNLANARGFSSLSLFDRGKELEAFVEAIKAGKTLQNQHKYDTEVTNAGSSVCVMQWTGVIRDETLIETDITAIFVNCLRSGAN